ncbi:MAG: hypothetical protein ACT4TC_19310, partial [Myxococcaceae bacterium]
VAATPPGAVAPPTTRPPAASAPSPRPPSAAGGPPRPSGAPRPSGPGGPPRPSGGPRPGGGGKSFGGGRGGPPRSRGPITPPTVEQINALAKAQRVPARIAKGELEGKMKARIWRKLHAEEAKRFDQVYALMDMTPGLELPDAFGVAQSGLTVPEFMARKARTQKKAQVKQARHSVDAAAVNGFVDALIADKTELAIVLAERTMLDVVISVEPVAFTFEKAGRTEKLQVVLMGKRAVWEKLAASVERDSKLAQKPASIVRQPEKRPVADPRPFVELVGRTLDLTLRNGLRLVLPVRSIGPFDLLLTVEDEPLFVPLHAVLRWQTAE